MQTHSLSVQLLLATLVGTLWLMAPPAALADAPGTRGDQPLPSGSAGSAGDWSAVRQLPPPEAAALPELTLPKSSEDGGQWAERQINVGSWILDAGMGIGSALIATMNYAITAGLRQLVDGIAGAAGCGGSVNILWCTPPELFLDPHSTVGGVVHTIWGTLEPLAIALIGVLFTVRIGRMIAAGPSGLAAEGKSLVISFAMALIWTKSAATVLRAAMGGLNELHGLVMTQAARELLSQPVAPAANLNFALQAATLVMLVVLIALVVKALMRVVQLTVLIAIAPLMGALLIDRSTSARFGQWLSKLVDVLLQQTAWVFFLWFGTLFYAHALPAGPDQIELMITGRMIAAVIFGMALGGEAILAGIGASAGGAGGLVGGAVGSLASGRFAAGTLRLALRATAHSTPSNPPASPPTRAPATADPQQSAAARRAGK